MHSKMDTGTYSTAAPPEPDPPPSVGPTASASKWLSVSTAPSNARLRLFCLPHAGSGSSVYHSWKRGLAPGVEVCPVLLPGREIRIAEPLVTDCAVLIGEMAAALSGPLSGALPGYLSGLPDKPYAIFGHSMGALLAFELAHALRDRGLRLPDCLFVSGRIAPHLPWGHPQTRQLPHDEFIAELGLRYGGLPNELLHNPDLLEIYLPILRADMTLLETHVHRERPPLDCPIMAFAGTQDANVPDASLHAWGQHTAASFSAQRFPGDHFYLSGPSRILLLAAIAKKLATLNAV